MTGVAPTNTLNKIQFATGTKTPTCFGTGVLSSGMKEMVGHAFCLSGENCIPDCSR